MKLGQLIKAIADYNLMGDPDQEIKGVVYDSRQVKSGYAFVAIKGHKMDGHHYLREAVQRGAAALVAERFEGSEENVAKVRVPDSRDALSKIAVAFYECPCDGLNLIGITGTNGKTTTSYLLESILLAAGAKPGVVGTINYRYSGEVKPAPVTTPESLDLMRLLREMADGGVTDVIMEVSSHALEQKRTEGCPFKVAVFTNLTRDHLDYHHTMEAYFKAKSLLFCGLRKDMSSVEKTAVINGDDGRGMELVSMTEAKVVIYGLGKACHVRANSILADKTGLQARLTTPSGERFIRSSLIGQVNIYNILASTAAALSLNIDLDTAVEGVARLEVVPGRLEPVKNERGLTIVVDYAHTPDALQKAHEALRPLAERRLITVFGCGGDRDRGKRYDMGLIAGQRSDLVFITSDNPRTEDPVSIMAQIEKGVKASGIKKMAWSSAMHKDASGYFMEVDRRKAICRAVALADEKDLVLIAGKGHEDYQIVGSERRFFDDRKEAALAASMKKEVME